MSRTIMLIPTGTSVGLTSVSLGVIRAMERKGVRLSVFKPIAQPRAGGDAPDQTTTIVRKNSNLPAAEPLKMSHVESLLSSNQKDVLMEGRLDAVIFTGGIGENAAMVRELSLGKLGVLGFEVDHERNLAARFGKSGFINKEGTRPAIVIPTNEELVIAQDAARLTA